jgi:hypothetical protein
MKVEFDRYEDIFYTKVKYIGQQKFRALETKNMAETYPMLQVFFIAECNLILKNYTVAGKNDSFVTDSNLRGY